MSGGQVYRTEVEVRWGDQNSFGHVDNTCFFTYFEQARVGFFHEIGIEVDKLRGQGEGAILARQECDYRKELTYPARVTVEITCEDVGNSSFTLNARMFRGDEAEPVAEARQVLVWFDYFTRQSQGLPPALRDAFRRYKAG